MDANLDVLLRVSLQIAAGGIQKATIPTCIENGDYLLRFEIIALHSAYDQGGAQFYVRPKKTRVCCNRTLLTARTRRWNVPRFVYLEAQELATPPLCPCQVLTRYDNTQQRIFCVSLHLHRHPIPVSMS